MRIAALATTFVLGLLSGCGSDGAPSHRSTSSRPPFTARPVAARVAPAAGGTSQVFRVHFRAGDATGTTGPVIRGYEAHLTRADGTACIVDTGGFFNTRSDPGERLTIVLDPNRMMGRRWCRGRFRGVLRFYDDYACPRRGTCRPPRGFGGRRARTVARLTFTVR
jgi:hypothetical protein